MPGGLLDQADNGALERAASRFLGRARQSAVRALAAIILKDGVVQTPEIRFLNFIGEGSDVVYDRANRAANIINHGAPVASSTTTVVSNTTAKVQNVSPTTDDADTDFPGWKLASYTPTGWAAAVVATHAPAQDPYIPTGASTIWDTASRPDTDPAQKLLVHQAFTLPAGTVIAATLESFSDAWGDIWLNGTAYGTAGTVGGGGSGALGPVSVAFSDLVLGGTNVLAVQGQDIARVSSAHDRSTAFRLVVTYSVAGLDTRYVLPSDLAAYQLRSEKDAASGYAGLDSGTKVPTAELGTGSASSSTWLRGDRSWQTLPSGFSDPMTTIGDLIYRNGSNVTDRLPAGTSGYVLTSNGPAAAPSYQASAGGSGGLTRIGAVVTISGSTASVSFSSIPSTYMALLLIGSLRCDTAGTGMAIMNVACNGDTTAAHFQSNGTASTRRIGLCAQASAGFEVPFTLLMADYARSLSGHMLMGTSGRTDTNGGEWDTVIWTPGSTGVLSSFVLSPASGNFTAGTLALYGVS